MNHSELLSLSRDFLARLHNLKKEDILRLREVVRENNRLYYQDEAPIISDTEYDELFHALARLESDHDMFDANSPTARLAIMTSEQFQKVKHVYPMISLDNTYSVEEVREWNERTLRVLKWKIKNEKWKEVFSRHSDEGRIQSSEIIKPGSFVPQDDWANIDSSTFNYYIQPKYDGLGLAIVYQYGKLYQAITRGSGVEGEDVTIGAFEIANIPKEIVSLKDTERMEIRGEVMMSRTEFDRVNRERLELGEKLFANPRNAASGSLRQLDPLITRSRNLQFFAYSIPQIEQAIETQNTKLKIQNYGWLMDLLVLWGFEREDFEFKNIVWVDALCSVLENETNHRREYFDFDIDGMVLKLDDMTLWDDLGRTEHHPRYAIAYKFPAKQVRTRVISIEHSVGRTGTVTPVANLEAVDVSGVVVRRATLHNYDELTKKWVREGDYVFIVRAGEVIPEVVSVLTEVRTGDEKEIFPPAVCPICSTRLEQDEGKVAIYCPNKHCPAKIQWQLEMFVGKQGFNIDGFGTKQIELFLELGWITDFVSVFHLGRYRDQFFELEGYKEKSVNNLLEALEKARHTTLDRVFVALGIPNVGKKTARLISSYELWIMSHDGIDMKKNLLQAILTTKEEQLLEIKDIGPETARAFVEYVGENSLLIERLLHELQIQIPSTKPANQLPSQPLFWKSFCVTGSFEWISRDEIHSMIEEQGGEVRTAVTGKLDYLIVGTDAGSKKSKAESLGVKCIGLEQLYLLTGI